MILSDEIDAIELATWILALKVPCVKETPGKCGLAGVFRHMSHVA
jgi:hypothetical protein